MVKRTLVKIQGEMKRSASRSPTRDPSVPTILECQYQDLRPPTQVRDEMGRGSEWEVGRGGQDR